MPLLCRHVRLAATHCRGNPTTRRENSAAARRPFVNAALREITVSCPAHSPSFSHFQSCGGAGVGEAAVTLICMHLRRPDDDLIFQITPSARSLGALMGPATTVHSDVTTFQTAGMDPMRQTAVSLQSDQLQVSLTVHSH